MIHSKVSYSWLLSCWLFKPTIASSESILKSILSLFQPLAKPVHPQFVATKVVLIWKNVCCNLYITIYIVYKDTIGVRRCHNWCHTISRSPRVKSMFRVCWNQKRTEQNKTDLISRKTLFRCSKNIDVQYICCLEWHKKYFKAWSC